MKSGVRAVGVAESYRGDANSSTVAGCVVRADQVVDGLAYASCTVGGMDATAAIESIWERLDRDDVQYVVLAGVALAWYNIVDLTRLQETVGRPVISVSFEASDGLTDAIQEAFDTPEARLGVYEELPDRVAMTINGEEVFIRSVGCSEATAQEVITAFTPEGGRPEPVRVARVAARAADTYRQPPES